MSIDQVQTSSALVSASLSTLLVDKEKPISLYFHIPFCARRCGYCDFNTYTPAELRTAAKTSSEVELLSITPAASTEEVVEVSAGFTDYLIKEFDLLRNACGLEKPVIGSIFIGGGTPTLLAAHQYKTLFDHLRKNSIIDNEVEITIEANPDTISLEYLQELKAVGFNRISMGMQSAVPHVLQTLDRTHNPANVPAGVSAARQAGFEEISVDLIYGTPGESFEDWQQSVEAALSLPITHISAYALIVEEGTKLARAISRSEIDEPDDDLTAEKYMFAEEKFTQAGFEWYELSNWAKPGSYSRHNYAYWQSGNWWGMGPGAHSHMEGMRWWNVKFPARYQGLLNSEVIPVQDQEILDATAKRTESILLKIRLREGLPISELSEEGKNYLAQNSNSQWFDLKEFEKGMLVLTAQGRLLADAIVRHLTD